MDEPDVAIPVEVDELIIDQITSDCFTRLKWKMLETNKYHLIHGDCQFSNILYNSQDSKVYLVDPRGYFGKSYVYGYQAYDYGKIAYALSGYDHFNDESNLFSLG